VELRFRVLVPRERVGEDRVVELVADRVDWVVGCRLGSWGMIRVSFDGIVIYTSVGPLLMV
jgi:hypothetical protein